MAVQTRVGVPMIQALNVASQDCEKPHFRGVLAGVTRHLEAGSFFWEALEKYPHVFSPHFVSVVRAGESSSKLPETFDDLRGSVRIVIYRGRDSEAQSIEANESTPVRAGDVIEVSILANQQFYDPNPPSVGN